jgi:hypothetical protein
MEGGKSSCTSPPSMIPRMEQALAAVRASERGAEVKILVGGGGMIGGAELAKTWGADDHVSHALEAVARGNALVGLPASIM